MISIFFLAVALSTLLGVVLGFALAREEMRDMSFDELFCYWRNLQVEEEIRREMEKRERP